MNTIVLKNQVKMLLIFILFLLIFFSQKILVATSGFFYKDQVAQGIMSIFTSRDSLEIIAFLFFSSIVFGLLFRYQLEEVKPLYLLIKFLVISIISSILWSFIFFYIEACAGACFMYIFLYSPIVILFLTLFSSAMVLNYKYKTNLFVAICTPLIFVFISSSSNGTDSWLLPFSFLAGTVVAIFLKKASNPKILRNFLISIAIVITPFIVSNIISLSKSYRRIDGEAIPWGSELQLPMIIALIVGIVTGAISFIYGRLKNNLQ